MRNGILEHGFSSIQNFIDSQDRSVCVHLRGWSKEAALCEVHTNWDGATEVQHVTLEKKDGKWAALEAGATVPGDMQEHQGYAAQLLALIDQFTQSADVGRRKR